MIVGFLHTPGTNAEVSGAVYNMAGNDTRVDLLSVEFDTDGDGVADSSTVTDSVGNFTDEIGPLSGDIVTVYARVGDADGWSNWNSYQIELPDPPSIGYVGYQSGTSAELTGTVMNDNGTANLTVQLDTDMDGTPDATATTTPGGGFDIAFDAAIGQQTTVQLRAIDADGTGAWTQFTFTPQNEAPQIANGYLYNDDGVLPFDGITSDGTIAGSVDDDTGTIYEIEIDLDGDGASDLTTTTDANGDFNIDLTSYLSVGEVTVQLRAVEDAGANGDLTGEWSSLTFDFIGV